MATPPVPKTWVDGELVTPQDMNTEIRDAHEYLLSTPPFLRVGYFTNAAEASAFIFRDDPGLTVAEDTDAMYGGAFLDQIFTIQTPGLYQVTVESEFSGSTAGEYRDSTLKLTVGGLEYSVGSRTPPSNPSPTQLTASTVIRLNAGDYGIWSFSQGSGTTIAIEGTLTVLRISA